MCWNGETVRVAFVLDCQVREIIGWTATAAGLSGEMIRDMMVQSVEAHFRAPRAPHCVQWLSDNGSIYVAAKTSDTALALNLDPCFTPVESHDSSGMAGAFVKTDTARHASSLEPCRSPPSVWSDGVNFNEARLLRAKGATLP